MVPWAYPFIMLAAIVTAFLLSRQFQQALNLERRQRIAIAIGAFSGGMIGAKLPFVLTDWDGLVSGAAWLDNGKTLVMGLVGGYFGVELAKHAVHVRVKTGDGFAVPVAAAVAIGRLGCLAAGCCYGAPTTLPWGIDFGDGIRRHPNQLYELIFHAFAAVFLAYCYRRRWFRCQLIKLYIIAYLAFRFFTEFLRPEPALVLSLTAYQWAALAFIPLFILFWIEDARHLAKPPNICAIDE